MPAFNDVWFLGDRFVESIRNTFLDMQQNMEKNRRNSVPPFMLEYFNVKMLHDANNAQNSLIISRTLNNLIQSFNAPLARLPKYLIVVMDEDILWDIDVATDEAPVVIQRLVTWFVRQINIAIRRKRMDLMEKKPGASCTTKVIYVRMIRRIEVFSGPITARHNYRAKLNDAINTAVAKIGEHMLTINSCNMYEHFDSKGKLTETSRKSFIHEIDYLLQCFDLNKIKLLPTLKNPRKHQSWKKHSYEGFQHHNYTVNQFADRSSTYHSDYHY